MTLLVVSGVLIGDRNLLEIRIDDIILRVINGFESAVGVAIPVVESVQQVLRHVLLGFPRIGPSNSHIGQSVEYVSVHYLYGLEVPDFVATSDAPLNLNGM